MTSVEWLGRIADHIPDVGKHRTKLAAPWAPSGRGKPRGRQRPRSRVRVQEFFVPYVTKSKGAAAVEAAPVTRGGLLLLGRGAFELDEDGLGGRLTDVLRVVLFCRG